MVAMATATTGKKRGRKPKPYVASWGEIFPGLRRRPSDGRWQALGKVWSEPRRAEGNRPIQGDDGRLRQADNSHPSDR